MSTAVAIAAAAAAGGKVGTVEQNRTFTDSTDFTDLLMLRGLIAAAQMVAWLDHS
jgi:hypothetical protein